MMDDANDLHIMDYEFTLGLGSYETCLKRKKSFLSPKNKNKRGKQSGSLEIDFNVPASEYEPFLFQHLNKHGCPHSNNASSVVLDKFHKVMISTCLD